MKRRDWLKRAGASTAVAVPGVLLGDTQSNFEAQFAQLVGNATVKPDDRIEVLVPSKAANGAVVPVGVISGVPNTLSIVLLVDNHTRSKVAQVDTSNALFAPRMSTHLQLQHPATITALVKTDSGWHSNFAQVTYLGESCEK